MEYQLVTYLLNIYEAEKCFIDHFPRYEKSFCPCQYASFLVKQALHF